MSKSIMSSRKDLLIHNQTMKLSGKAKLLHTDQYLLRQIVDEKFWCRMASLLCCWDDSTSLDILSEVEFKKKKEKQQGYDK